MSNETNEGVYKACVSLAMQLRKNAHMYRKWALENSVGSDLYVKWREQSDKDWQHAKWNIQRARWYK